MMLFASFAIVGGCMINPYYLPGQYNVVGTTSHSFGLLMTFERLQELGGKDSKEFASFIQQVADKRMLCPDGCEVTDVRGNERTFVTVGVKCVGSPGETK